MSLNKVTLIGRLGKDPEIRTTKDGREIANFSLATSDKWKDKATGERKEKTEWHRVVVFTPALVSLVKSYIKKGSHIYLEGSLCTRKWQNKEGVDIYTTEVMLQGFGSAIVLLESKKEGRPENHDYKDLDYKNQTPVEPETSNNFVTVELDDEVPF